MIVAKSGHFMIETRCLRGYLPECNQLVTAPLTVACPRLENVTTTASHALLDGLNPQQRAAVTHAGGPLLIVAGAGSGKTRVLTPRIAYLLAERDVWPGEILAFTFPNKAPGKMPSRVAERVGDRRARAMWVMTFPSACVRILRREAA